MILPLFGDSYNIYISFLCMFYNIYSAFFTMLAFLTLVVGSFLTFPMKIKLRTAAI